jgi:hypothetical protein
VLTKEIRQQGQNILVVIDEQKMGHRVHPRSRTLGFFQLMSGGRAFVTRRTHGNARSGKNIAKTGA